MATVTTDTKQFGVPQMITGHFTSDNAAQTLSLGFVPSYIKIFNETDAVVWEKTKGMAAANAIKIDTAVALDTNSYILINTDGTVTLHASLVGNSKAIKFVAMA